MASSPTAPPGPAHRGAMARQKAFLQVGLPAQRRRPARRGARAARCDALVDQRAQSGCPPSPRTEMFSAAVEIRRDHRAWALRRKDVEGAWASSVPPGHKTRTPWCSATTCSRAARPRRSPSWSTASRLRGARGRVRRAAGSARRAVPRRATTSTSRPARWTAAVQSRPAARRRRGPRDPLRPGRHSARSSGSTPAAGAAATPVQRPTRPPFGCSPTPPVHTRRPTSSLMTWWSLGEAGGRRGVRRAGRAGGARGRTDREAIRRGQRALAIRQ